MTDEPMSNDRYRALDEAIAEGALPAYLEKLGKNKLIDMLIRSSGPNPSDFVDSYTRRMIRNRVEFLEECERKAWKYDLEI